MTGPEAAMDDDKDEELQLALEQCSLVELEVSAQVMDEERRRLVDPRTTVPSLDWPSSPCSL